MSTKGPIRPKGLFSRKIDGAALEGLTGGQIDAPWVVEEFDGAGFEVVGLAELHPQGLRGVGHKGAQVKREGFETDEHLAHDRSDLLRRGFRQFPRRLLFNVAIHSTHTGKNRCERIFELKMFELLIHRA